MTSRLKEIRLDGFDGGLFSINKGFGALPNQLIQADNVIILNNGEVRKRPGIISDTSFATSKQIIAFCRPFHVRYGTGVYNIYNASGTLMFSSTTGGRGTFLHVNDKYIYSDGINKMQVWASSDSSTNDVAGTPPLSRFLLKHNDRCFCAENNVLYETEVDTYPDKTTDYFATGASWTIGDSTTNITGIESIGRDLIIFKERSIFIQTGSTRNERQTSLFTDSVGCVAPDTIKSVELKGIGKGLIFLGHNAKLYFLSLSGLMQIGEAVKDKLDAIHYGTPVNEVALSDNMHRAVAGVMPEGYYLLGYADSATDTYEAWDKCLCVHLNKITQNQFGTRPAITLFKYVDYSHASKYASYNCFSCFGDPLKNNYSEKLSTVCRFLDGFSTMEHNIGVFDIDTYQDVDYDTTVRESCDEIRTSYANAGAPDYLKNWVEAVIRCSKHDTAGLTGYIMSQLHDSDGTTSIADEQITMNLTPDYVEDIIVSLVDDYAKISLSFSVYKVPYYLGPNPMDMRLHSILLRCKISSEKVSSSTRYL